MNKEFINKLTTKLSFIENVGRYIHEYNGGRMTAEDVIHDIKIDILHKIPSLCEHYDIGDIDD